MRIAISADDRNGLDGVVSPHFGRCPYFVLVDVQGQEVRAVSILDNPYFRQHSPGQVPAFIHDQGARVMLTGGMGGRAIGFFQQYGIEAVTGAAGTVRHALQLYLGGALSGFAPCRESIEHGHGDAGVPAAGAYEKDELGRLREEAELLRQQMTEVSARLERLGGQQ
jgi:predicted Fe-Mo cluster-binding NifX family protein